MFYNTSSSSKYVLGVKTAVLYWLITLTTDLKSKTLTSPWHYHHYPVSVSPFPHSTDTQPPVASSPFFIHHTMYIACPVTNDGSAKLWRRCCLIKDLQLELSLPSVASDCQVFFKGIPYWKYFYLMTYYLKVVIDFTYFLL